MTLLQQMRSALASLRAARGTLAGRSPGSCALVRDGRVEVVSARRAATVRSRPPRGSPTLLAELDGRARPSRLTFLVAPDSAPG